MPQAPAPTASGAHHRLRRFPNRLRRYDRLDWRASDVGAVAGSLTLCLSLSLSNRTIWPRIKALEGLKRFAGLGDNMQSDSDEWQRLVSGTPILTLNLIQTLTVTRSLTPILTPILIVTLTLSQMVRFGDA